MTKRNRLTAQEGLTLVEIAIVVAIIALVAVLGIPTTVKMMPRIRLGNDTVTLANQVMLARAGAIAKNQERRITFSSASDSYDLYVWDTPSSSWNNFATDTLSGNIDLYDVHVFDPPSTVVNASTLTVRAVGSVGRTDGGGNFLALDPGEEWRIYMKTPDNLNHRRIRVQPTGRIIVEKSRDGSSWVEE